VECGECHGANVVDTIDDLRCSPELLAEWDSWFKDVLDMEAEYAAERRMGA
jgi:hypothetical protein